MEDSCPGQLSLMTIFYSGNMNVYQNVPADKANAIMLLLSNDKSESGCANTGKLPANLVFNINMPPRPPSSADLHTSALMQVQKKVRPVVIKRSQAELPFARKASLTRFLQKRKDRVEARVKETCADDHDHDVEAASGGLCSILGSEVVASGELKQRLRDLKIADCAAGILPPASHDHDHDVEESHGNPHKKIKQ